MVSMDSPTVGSGHLHHPPRLIPSFGEGQIFLKYASPPRTYAQQNVSRHNGSPPFFNYSLRQSQQSGAERLKVNVLQKDVREQFNQNRRRKTHKFF